MHSELLAVLREIVRLMDLGVSLSIAVRVVSYDQ
jgi:hypothetical protein